MPAVLELDVGCGMPQPSTALLQNCSPALCFSVCACACCCANHAAMISLLPLLVLAVPMAWLWQPMPATDIPILLLMGALATGGMLCITWAFSHIEASRAAPVEYTGLVWAALLGFLVFGEVPTVWSLSSAALIMVGCLLLVRR